MDDEVKNTIIEFYANLAQIEGYPKSLGEIYGIIFYSNEPLCIDDIMEQLGVSKGNVSMNLNKLEELGFIKKVWIKGDRKNYYTISEGFSAISNIIKKRYNLVNNYLEKIKKYQNNNENKEIIQKIRCIERINYINKIFVEVINEIEINKEKIDELLRNDEDIKIKIETK